jgi:hypothetical protein
MNPGEQAAVFGKKEKRGGRKTYAFGIIPSFVIAAFAFVHHNSLGDMKCGKF